jgi:ubiquinone/menaquinone biosynthesis C-methylase UbiE
MKPKDQHWQVTPELAAAYTSPLDRKLFCDDPLVELLGDVSQASIIDLGCGNGGFTSQLASAKTVVGVDTSDEMLEQARKLLANAPNTSFVKADAAHLPLADASSQRVVASMLVNTIGQK